MERLSQESLHGCWHKQRWQACSLRCLRWTIFWPVQEQRGNLCSSGIFSVGARRLPGNDVRRRRIIRDGSPFFRSSRGLGRQLSFRRWGAPVSQRPVCLFLGKVQMTLVRCDHSFNTTPARLKAFATVHSDVGSRLPPPCPKTIGRKNTPKMTRAPPRRLRIAPMRADSRCARIEQLSFLFLRHECSLGLPTGERFIRLPWFGSGESISKVRWQEQMSF